MDRLATKFVNLGMPAHAKYRRSIYSSQLWGYIILCALSCCSTNLDICLRVIWTFLKMNLVYCTLHPV